MADNAAFHEADFDHRLLDVVHASEELDSWSVQLLGATNANEGPVELFLVRPGQDQVSLGCWMVAAEQVGGLEFGVSVSGIAELVAAAIRSVPQQLPTGGSGYG